MHNYVIHFGKGQLPPVKTFLSLTLGNRWGSLTKRHNLNLNLVKDPGDVIDYVVLHELCHLKINEHSDRYYAIVHKFMPNYREKIEWSKIYGSNLLWPVFFYLWNALTLPQIFTRYYSNSFRYCFQISFLTFFSKTLTISSGNASIIFFIAYGLFISIYSYR